jgi:hypothetical protein
MGLVPLLLRRSDGAVFLVALFWVTYFFAQKMRRSPGLKCIEGLSFPEVCKGCAWDLSGRLVQLL